MKTTLIQEKDVERKWYQVDASGKPAGRLAAEIAAILRGKTKPTFAPHIDGGDFVVVTNIENINECDTYFHESFVSWPLDMLSACQKRNDNIKHLNSALFKS